MTVFEFLLPDLGEGIADAEVVEWFVPVGGSVTAHAPLVEVQTDKALVELPAPVDGTVQVHGAAVGGIIKVGDPIAVIAMNDADGNSPGRPATPAGEVEPTPAGEVEPATERELELTPARGRAIAAPTVRQLARDLAIDLSRVVGSGAGGRVLRDDVERAAHTTIGTDSATPDGGGPHMVDAGVGADEGDVRVPLRGLRRSTSRKMTQTLREVPQVSNMFEVDVTDLDVLRHQLKPAAAEHGVRLTWTVFFAMAVLKALRELPQLNATFDAQADEVVLHSRVHLGIATETEDGLLVPVVRDADRLSLIELARGIDRVAGSARSRTATVADLTGSTFTISNYGSVGGWFGTPVVNAPEVGIAGFGEIAQRPAVVQGQLAVRTMVAVSVTVDHRWIDGADNARFGTAIRRNIEQPHGLLLGARLGDG